jgi:hypothetical protein
LKFVNFVNLKYSKTQHGIQLSREQGAGAAGRFISRSQVLSFSTPRDSLSRSHDNSKASFISYGRRPVRSDPPKEKAQGCSYHVNQK